jgi:hypothetical protein
MYKINADALDLISALKGLDQDRHNLNMQEQGLGTTSFDTGNYAAEWGCEPTFDAVDHQMEQRGESYMWKIGEALGVDWDTACKCYATVSGRETVKEIMAQYTVRQIRHLLAFENPDRNYTIRLITKRVWALRLWTHRYPEAGMQEQVQQMEGL